MRKTPGPCNVRPVDSAETHSQVRDRLPLMKIRFASRAAALAGLLFPAAAHAADAVAPTTWHAQSLPQALAYMVLFSAVGIVAAIAGYKLFDKCTPGDLHREILENKNTAAAIIGGSVIVGVCMIIAAAMIG